MKAMETVMALRLPEDDVVVIDRLAEEEQTDKSSTARELIELGRVYLAIKKYKENKISLGKAAELAGIVLSEMIDLLAEMGIKSHLEVDDYLEGVKVAEKIF